MVQEREEKERKLKILWWLYLGGRIDLYFGDESAFSTNPIVITFNVTEDFPARLFDQLKRPPSTSSALNREKKRVRLDVIVTITASPHRLPETVNIQKAAIFNRRILAAAIGMNDRAAFYRAATCARLNASSTSCAVIRSATCQPTMSRVNLS